jgi:hypothetical protein
MILYDTDYYCERALNERELAMTAPREKTRRIREEFERQNDAMLGPKKIRSILSIVLPTASKALS